MKCRICNSEIDTNYRNPYPKLLTENELCYDCYFWFEKLEKYNNGDESYIVTNRYKMYYVGDEDEDTYFRGHGGNKFSIELTDGKVFTSTNLWYNGEIPSEFHSMLEPNVVKMMG